MVEIMWEKTVVRFRIDTEVDSKVMAQIQRALDPKRDAGLYYQIASYLYDNDKDMVKAYDLITKSVDMQPQYWTVHLKAKIEYKLRKFNEAVATAERSMAMAKEAGNADYVRLNEKLIAEAKKSK
jgi:tetratricopeptide (TPR) repeat protein